MKLFQSSQCTHEMHNEIIIPLDLMITSQQCNICVCGLECHTLILLPGYTLVMLRYHTWNYMWLDKVYVSSEHDEGVLWDFCLHYWPLVRRISMEAGVSKGFTFCCALKWSPSEVMQSWVKICGKLLHKWPKNIIHIKPHVLLFLSCSMLCFSTNTHLMKTNINPLLHYSYQGWPILTRNCDIMKMQGIVIFGPKHPCDATLMLDVATSWIWYLVCAKVWPSYFVVIFWLYHCLVLSLPVCVETVEEIATVTYKSMAELAFLLDAWTLMWHHCNALCSPCMNLLFGLSHVWSSCFVVLFGCAIVWYSHCQCG